MASTHEFHPHTYGTCCVFYPGVKIDEEAKTRRARLDMIKQRKLNELIEQGVDQKYLYSVKRKAAQVTST